MNAAEAESLLPIHRTGRRADGRLQKAVRMAERDEALRQKLSEQMEFDDQIVDVIHFIRPPEDLRQMLRDANARPHPDGRLRSHVFNPAMLSAILGVLLIFGFIGWTVMERMENFQGREAIERMLSATNKLTGDEFDPVATTSGTLGDWFYMRGYEGYSLPAEIGALPAVGSRVFRQEGHPVAQLAIDRNNSILFVFRASEFGIDIPADQPWLVFEYEGWATALQRRADSCFVVAFKGTKAEMRAYTETLKQP